MVVERVNQLRAVEALRAGVPNRDVVRVLPPTQEDIEKRYQTLLEATDKGWMEEKQNPGLLLEGDFGTGKSHWLEAFQHRALEENFVCSTIVVNKETPLYDLAKVYRACAEAATVRGRFGPVLPELALAYRRDRAPGHQEFYDWVHQHPTLDPRFAATLDLFGRNTDPEFRRRLMDDWIGDAMPVTELRNALKESGRLGAYPISRPIPGQTLLRFEFLSRFFSSAGYAGWVILLDEAEMISKYSLRQRGRAYSHLAQLLGLVRGARVSGLACVATITKDYAGQVLYGRKNDIENIPARLQNTKDAEHIPSAEVGMRAIKSKGVELRPPSRAQVQETYAKVRALYSDAYGWEAPEVGPSTGIAGAREYSSSTGMRQYVRGWVNIWDLRRLYDYEADLVVHEERFSYDEDPAMQIDTREESDEPIIAT
jgi:hypothetical protein